MLFHSLEFAFFIPVVFAVYWLAGRRGGSAQNAVAVAASALFYGWWDVRFLILIAVSTAIDYVVGLGLNSARTPVYRKLLLTLSIVVNLGLLGFFKYANFFIVQFTEAFSLFGKDLEPRTLNIILPVGISFYTFQTLSYSIDVYRRRLEPTRDPLAFAAFVTFFPQLVAGPIERATKLLPQFTVVRRFNRDEAVDGLRQILWGLFKKLVIADNAARHADMIFNYSDAFSGSTLLIGSFFFAFQIYGDFSGYSDMAIGTARLFGIRLSQNFNFPYFSRDVAEFWRRWHISLSTWFRDYVYIPLGGSRGSRWQTVRNTFAIFTVSGLWHGANLTFIAWGVLHALYFLPLQLTKRNRRHMGDLGAEQSVQLGHFVSMAVTFTLVTLAWVLFRSKNLVHATSIFAEMASASLFSEPIFPNRRHAFYTGLLILLFLGMEWMGRHNRYAIETTALSKPRFIRYGLYYSLFLIILAFGCFSGNAFIYFQF